jgi:hypothetical protein
MLWGMNQARYARLRHEALAGGGIILADGALVPVLARSTERMLVLYEGHPVWVDRADLEPVPLTAWERLGREPQL